MTRRIALRQRAVHDLDAAVAWYESQRSGLGLLFLGRVLERLKQIRERPTAFPIAARAARCARVKRFPYAIYYETYPDHILVVAVYHLMRSPEGWKADEN